jgi:hypothetical protein
MFIKQRICLPCHVTGGQSSLALDIVPIVESGPSVPHHLVDNQSSNHIMTIMAFSHPSEQYQGIAPTTKAG